MAPSEYCNEVIHLYVEKDIRVEFAGSVEEAQKKCLPGQQIYITVRYCPPTAKRYPEGIAYVTPVVTNDSPLHRAMWMAVHKTRTRHPATLIWQLDDLFFIEIGDRRNTYKFYDVYSKSMHWKLKASRLKKLFPSCAKCGSDKKLTFHHYSYDSIPFELVGDIDILCGKCHYRLHMGTPMESPEDDNRHVDELVGYTIPRAFTPQVFK